MAVGLEPIAERHEQAGWRGDGLASASMPSAFARMLAKLRGTLEAWCWGLLGFLLGAAFWHFVGFWSFVSDVLLHGPGATGRPVLSGPAFVSHSIIADGACSDLVLDRAAGVTRVAACPRFEVKVPRSAGAARGDRLAVGSERSFTEGSMADAGPAESAASH